jgi:hypothetical protein
MLHPVTLKFVVEKHRNGYVADEDEVMEAFIAEASLVTG